MAFCVLQRQKILLPCPECVLLLTMCARIPSVCVSVGVQYISARMCVCVYCIQSCACAYFWLLSVWEWENIHIAHLGSSWEPIELSYWKTPCCFFGGAQQADLTVSLVSYSSSSTLTPLFSLYLLRSSVRDTHLFPSSSCLFLYVISQGAWNYMESNKGY